jgi:ABC-2 type transport system ATP-binding protein
MTAAAVPDMPGASSAGGANITGNANRQNIDQVDPTDAAVSFSGVAKRFGTVQALSDVSLVVRRGEMFGLIGADGSGKTTLIRLLCGLLHPDGGEIRVLGRDPVRERAHVTAHVGYLSQRFSLYGDLTVDENIEFFAEIHGVRDYATRRDTLLDLIQLTPFRRRLADRLSGGMKQKLALACTLIHQPDVIVLDEPTTGVDPVSRREFWKLLSEFLSEGITIVMSTPYMDEAERCGRVALLHEGKVLALDEPGRLRDRVEGRMVEVLLTGSAGAADRVRVLPSVVDAQVFGERLHVTLDGMSDELLVRFTSDLQAAGIVSPIRTVRPTLEDVFISQLTRIDNAGA